MSAMVSASLIRIPSPGVRDQVVANRDQVGGVDVRDLDAVRPAAPPVISKCSTVTWSSEMVIAGVRLAPLSSTMPEPGVPRCRSATRGQQDAARRVGDRAAERHAGRE